MSTGNECAACGRQLPNRRSWFHYLEVGPQDYRRICEDSRQCDALAGVAAPAEPAQAAEETAAPVEPDGPQLTLL